jgi:hypothetical protein
MRHSHGQIWRWAAGAGRTGAVLGTVLCAAGVAVASPVPGVQSVSTSQLRIVYEVNPEALPLESVTLWYTTDLGQTWERYGDDDDLRSPILFEAADEGLYGFYPVLRNAVGVSSPDPVAGTMPLQQVLVDLSRPLVQAHSAVIREADGKQVVQIRWTAYDAHFGPRPITLEYRPVRETQWRTIARAVANEERYEWEVPQGVVGEVVIRLTARDSAGNVATAAFSPVEIRVIEPEEPAAEEETMDEAASPAPTEADLSEAQESLESEGKARELAALLAQARWHQERGEWPLARQRLSELLAVAPHDAPGLKMLAEVEYQTGEYSDALRGYHEVLRWHPEDTEALHGRALAEVALGDYSAAASSLKQILKLKPGDPETQLYFGDVLLMMGQRGEAREAWQQAGQAVGAGRDVASKAARRLELYPPSNR